MKNRKKLQILICSSLLMILAGIGTPATSSADDIKLSSGQTVYVPIYSHIYSGVKARPFALASTLSIRNTNLTHPITLVSVKYYDSGGKLVEDYLSQPKQMKALETTRYVITEGDKSGGSGANYIVVWKSDKKVNQPIIEAVMIGTQSSQGISFLSRGQVIKEDL